MLGNQFFFQECPYFNEGGRGEKYQKISLIKMSLFMVGGEGLIEIGTKSLSLHFYFFEGLPNAIFLKQLKFMEEFHKNNLKHL